MKRYIVILSMAAIVGCTSKSKLTQEALRAYEKEIEEWHTNRIEKVKAPNGWLNLAGLYWLDPGVNTFGSGKKNKIIFPAGKIAEEAGYFLVIGNRVDIHVKPGVSITVGDKLVQQQTIFYPDSTPVILKSGPLRWNIIKRDDKLAVRLRDDTHEVLTTFEGIDRYPIDPEYRVVATFVKSDSLKTIDITNIVGQTTAQRSPGTVVFTLKDDEYRLDVLDGGAEELFIVMADATSGNETYGGGRFIYAKRSDANGKVVLDFNKAYNPPCVFTPYATCPLPPAQNVLPIAIKAGEKKYDRKSGDEARIAGQ